jgi:hypothetical protein
MSKGNTVQNLRSAGRVVALIFAFFSVLTYVMSLVLGPILFYSTPDGLSVAAHHLHELPVDIFMGVYTAPIPLGVSYGVLFAGMWVIFVLCFALAGLSEGGFYKSFKEVLSKPIALAKTNFLYMMPLVASGLLYATVLITQIQETQGVKTGSLNFPPKTSPYVILLNLAFAPLNEEFAFRITTIGIPLAILLLIRYRSDPKLASIKSRVGLFFLTMFSPELAKSKMGYRNVATNGLLHGISLLEWVLILLSSFVFGAAHFLLGGGWEIGKVSTAFLAGFVFAIMYVSYGAYADILLHWFFNYHFTVLDMASTAYGSTLSGLVNIAEGWSIIGGVIIVIVVVLTSAVTISDHLTKRAAGLNSKAT